MLHRLFPPLLALSTPAALTVAEPQAPRAPGVVMGQMTIHERIVIRVPRMGGYPAAGAPAASAAPVEWKERKGPKCLLGGEMAAAAIVAPATVDLLLVDGRRIRAKLERDCRSADFYSGLYMRPGSDGRICADRDAIRVRSGAACAIEHFRLLEPKR